MILIVTDFFWLGKFIIVNNELIYQNHNSLDALTTYQFCARLVQ